MKFRVGVLILCCVALGRAADASTFDSFLLTIGTSKRAPATALLSEAELHDVVAAAASYCRQTFALGYSGIVFEARMRAIESGTEAGAAWQQERLAQLDRRKAELLAGHVAQLKRALGDRFESYVDSWHQAMLDAPRAAPRK